MNRTLTILCLLAAIGSGLYVYSEKHRTALLDRDISHVIRATQAARERTGLLRAEWALLNEPGRLQEMADKYLQLKPMAPTQFVQVADLATRLPAPVAPPAPGSAADTGTDDDAAAQSAPQTPVAANATNPDTANSAVPQTPKPGAAAHAAIKLARTDLHAKAAHHLAVADRADSLGHDGPLMRGTPLPLASPQPIGAHVFSAMAHRMHTRSPNQNIVAAVPSYATTTSYIGTSLGGRSMLPPPVPLGGSAP